MYKVKLKTKDYEKTFPFNINIDPNLKGISKEDLDEQFELANRIMQKTTAANNAVIRIRQVKKNIDSVKSKISSEDYKNTMVPFLEKISSVEEELYQVKNQSGQDPLNFPIKLNNRLASLRRSVENGDAKPTDGAYKVFEELSGELDQHLSKLKTVMTENLPKVNSILNNAGVGEIEASE